MTCCVFALAVFVRFAGDGERVGVGLSRMSQIASTAIERLLASSHPLRAYLDLSKIANIEKEAKLLLPHLKAACVFVSLCLVGSSVAQMLIASAEQRKRSRKSEGGHQEIMSQQATISRTFALESCHELWLSAREQR